MLKRLWVMLLITSALLLNCDNNTPIDSRFAPKIAWQPQSQVVLLGNSATFSVSVAGDPAPAFQWYKADSLLSGQTDSTLTIPAVIFADSGTYAAVISNSEGTITSDSVKLTVYWLSVQPASDTVSVGNSFTFTATITGIPGPAYQWTLDGFDIPGATGLTYSKTAATLDDAGTYRLTVTSSTVNNVYSEPVPLMVNP